ncbi:glycoside hydrolase family 5 protein [Psychromonas sp. MME2]|uniref:glycoside hydrolase family 5 protein n=1 Tax=unclassified Psychromonas TaxID=2614957 RepID=UPI00339CAA9A
MNIFRTHYLMVLIFVGCIYNLVGCNGGDSTSTSVDNSVVLSESYYKDLYSWNGQGGLQQTQLGRGLNLGNYLEAPAEGEWTGGRLLVEEDLQRISDAGFKTVRIPVRWTAHTELESPYAIDSVFMERVKEVVGWANNEGLKVILNVHHYEEMMNDPENMQSKHVLRLQSIWQQISEQFPLYEYPRDNLIFELLNEPNGTIDYSDWNNIIAKLLNVIWSDMATQQNNGTEQRTVMIGTANWGHPDGLTKLSLPDTVNATNTIITVHYYEPFHFTHQGAEWVAGADKWVGTPWLGTASEQTPLIALFDRVTTWNNQANRGFEIFMGEFGVYSQFSNPLHQKAWTAFIAREAEKRNISWAYWEYASGFGAYDASTGQWREQLINALIPIQ